eukprot:g2848.t1
MALAGRNAVIFGVANKWSLAWTVAKQWHQAGANLALVCASDRIAGSVRGLVNRQQMKINDIKDKADVHNDDTSQMAANQGTNSLFEMTVHTCDVTNDDDVQSLVQELRDGRFSNGKLHNILHSVAFSPTGTLNKNYTDVTFDEYTKTQNASAYSLVRICKYAKPMLISGGQNTQGGASILSLTFIGGSKIVPNYHAVGVAKSSLESSTRYLASEFGEHNVRVNCIGPGPINTAAARGIPNFRDFEKRVKEKTLLKRNTTPKDVASVATFLASDDSSCITGQTLYIDCGFNVVAPSC